MATARPRRGHFTGIYSSNFDGFVSEVAADIWNKLVETPGFHQLKPRDYVGIFDVVTEAMKRYQQERKL